VAKIDLELWQNTADKKLYSRPILHVSQKATQLWRTQLRVVGKQLRKL